MKYDRVAQRRCKRHEWQLKITERIMVKKSSKESLEQMYRGIIEKKGRKWDDCKVLSFVFKRESQAELFHYGLMNEKPDYFVFDSWERHANVIASKDERNAAVIIAIAAKNGGEKTTPNLR